MIQTHNIAIAELIPHFFPIFTNIILANFMEQNRQFSRPILKNQKTEIDKNIKLLRQVLFLQIKKYRENNENEKEAELLFFLEEIQNLENYREKYFNLDFIIRNIYKLEVENERIVANLDKICDKLLELDLQIRINTIVNKTINLGIILGNGAINWQSDNKFIQN